MKTYGTIQYRERKRGAALMPLMIIMLLVVGTGAYMAKDVKQQICAVTRVRDYLKAQAYAEAGANAAYSLLKANFDLRRSAANFSATRFSDGYYETTVTAISSNMASITCVGHRGAVNATVMMDVKNFDSDASSLSKTSPWDFGVFVNGYLDHNGTGTQTGDTYVNGHLISSGGGGLVWGTETKSVIVRVRGADGASFAGGGTIYGSCQAVSFPKQTPTPCSIVTGLAEKIDMPDISEKLMEYYNIALANGQVYYSAPTAILGSVPGDIRWYECSGGIDPKDVDYAGAVICTGPITFKGGFKNTRVGDLPAVVSRDGSITCKGAHTVNGLVYAQGDILWCGAGSIVGTIICGGNMRFNGSYGNLAYANSKPGTANGSLSAGADQVRVVAWQR